MEGNILDAMRYVGAGLAMIGAAGAGVGIGGSGEVLERESGMSETFM